MEVGGPSHVSAEMEWGKSSHEPAEMELKELGCRNYNIDDEEYTMEEHEVLHAFVSRIYQIQTNPLYKMSQKQQKPFTKTLSLITHHSCCKELISITLTRMTP